MDDILVTVRPELVEGHRGFDKLSPNGVSIYEILNKRGRPGYVRVVFQTYNDNKAGLIPLSKTAKRLTRKYHETSSRIEEA